MKLLLTGASGFLGWHICQQIPPQFEVHGVYYRQNYAHQQVHWHKCNLLEEKDLSKMFNELKPDIVVHAAAIANANFCEEHPALSYHVNVYSTIALAELCEAANIPLLFISSDLVFNGNNAPYEEEDFPFPISRYGEQKLAAEEALLDDFKKTMVCRLPLLFGFGPDYSNCFFKAWLTALKKGEAITAFTDEYRTPISANTAAKGIWKCIDYLQKTAISPENHLIHLGGKERISRYELAQLMATVFEIENPKIERALRKDAALLAPRPEDVSLVSNLAAKLLNFAPLSIEAQLLALKNEAV